MFTSFTIFYTSPTSILPVDHISSANDKQGLRRIDRVEEPLSYNNGDGDVQGMSEDFSSDSIFLIFTCPQEYDFFLCDLVVVFYFFLFRSCSRRFLSK